MNHFKFNLIYLTIALAFAAANLFAGQGAQRMLYTVPNNSFIETPAGDNVITLNDTSGSIAALQSAVSNARTANPNSIIVINLQNGTTYSVSSVGIVLGSQECLVGSGAIIQAANSSVTVPLVTITNGATNVSIAGGTYDANGANIYGFFAPASSARINIDKVTVRNCGQDCIQLNGKGSGTFDNEMTVTRCDVSGSPGHSGISIWNATQTVCVDNFCHGNSVGIWIGNGGYCNIANNTCISNSTGINCNSGSDNYVVNNTCNNNGTGIYVGGSGNMIVSDLLASNSVAGINSSGSGNIYSDNVFASGNATNFINNGSGDDVVAYQAPLSVSGQNYFYPPLVNNQHTTTIVNGLGRYDLYDSSTGPIDNVQSEYNAAVSANPGSVIVLHLNGSYTVGSNPLTLSSHTCVLLGGKIQINSSSASQAIYATNASYISISGGTIDGGTTSSSGAGHNAIYFTGCSMFQIDGMTLQNFGTSGTRVGGSDVVRIDHGNTPRIVTRCTINNGSARGIWLSTAGIRDIVSDNTVTGVQMDGVDCDASTTASVIKNNYLANNTRYGVFLEQSASYNCVLGNICNHNASYDIGCYNNSATPRGATAYNSIVCNSLLGGNGLRNGSTGTNVVTSSDNFFFNNTVMSANIQSQLYGTQNYYSQNYMGNSSLSTSGTEVFFNSPDVSGNVQIQDSDSGLDAIVQNAATTNGAPVVTATTNNPGNNVWQLVPTDSGYYKIINENSGLALAVLGAVTNAGAPIIQWTFGAAQNDQWMPLPAGNGLYYLVNRHSGLALDVPSASTAPDTQLDQQNYTGAANQQFSLIDAPASAAQPTDGTWNTNNNANWSVPAAWLNGVIANGEDNTATFPASAITAARTVTLDTSRTIGNINFSGDNSYTIASSSGSILTLSTSVGTPSINVPSSSTAGVTESDTISALIGGNQGFAKTGGGFLILSGANTFAGTVSLAGSLRCNTTVSAFNNQPIIETGSANGDSIYLNAAGTYSGNCSIINYGPPETDPNASHLGAIRFATANVILSGTVTLLGDAGITPRGANAATISGQITGAHAIRFGRTSTSSSAGSGTLILSNPNNNWTGNTTNADGTVKSGAAGIIPSGAGFGDLIMTTPGIEYQPAIAPTVFDLNGFNQTVNGLSHDSSVPSDDLTLLVITNSSANTATLTVGNNNASGNYGGLIKGNNLNLTKIGDGTEALSGANTYGGGTIILGGTLALNGSISNSVVITIATNATLDASERADQTFTLSSGQMLQGNGTVNVNLTVGPNAAVMPGDSTNLGALTVASAAQLQGLTVMKLNAATTNSDQIAASDFIYGGTLTVTNISGALAAGQVFQLFAGDDYSGAFSAMNLPSLSNGLAWNTNNLTVDGTLQVVSMTKPQITGITLSGTNLILAGTNGVPGEQFVLLSSTNVALPLNQWMPVLTNTFNGETFSVTNTMDSAHSQNFYILQLQ